MLEVGLEIKILRERLEMSAKDLAERIGLSPSQMSRLEKGQRRVDTRVLARIAEALGVEPSYFFRGAEAPPEGGVIPPSDPGDPGKQIRSERRRRHVSAEDLAGRLGITKTKMLAIEEGKRPLEPELAEKICRILKLPANHFLLHQYASIRRLEAQVERLEQELAEQGRGRFQLPAGAGPGEAHGIPILGTLVGGYPESFDALGRPTAETDDFIYLPDVRDPAAFALHVVGDTMESSSAPSFSEGDLVVFGGGALRSRDFAFVRLEDDSPCFRQVFFDPAGRVRLQPLNLNYAARACRRDEVIAMWRLTAHLGRY